MIKLTNIVIVLVAFLLFFFELIIHGDLSFVKLTSRSLEKVQDVVLNSGLVFLLILIVLRFVMRWASWGAMRRVEKFDELIPISKSGKQRMILMNGIEIIYFTFFSVLFIYLLGNYKFGVLFIIAGIELLVFVVFRYFLSPCYAAINENGLFLADKQLKFYSFRQLEQISKEREIINFQYRKGKVKTINISQLDDVGKSVFYTKLRHLKEENSVYLDARIREYLKD